MTPRWTRRSIALALLACVVLAACGDPGDDSSGAVDDAIVVGVLTSLTGPFTPYGLQARAGMRMAAEEINAEGGVDGRLVELVVADDRNDADEAVTAMERMVERDGVLAVGGVISSSVGVALGPLAEELRTPLLVVKAGSPALLTTASRHTFRTCLPAAPMTAEPLLQYARDNDVDRVGVIVADYAWGQGVAAALEEAFADTEIELRVETAPVDARDFTTYLRELLAFEPSLVAATGHPPGVGQITIQAADLGLDAPVVGPWAALATVVEAVGEVAYDSYTDYSCADFASPGYHELAARFADAGDATFMEGDAVAGYAIVRLVAEAVRAGATTPTEVADHLRTNEFTMPGYSHPLAWTEYGELASSQPTLSVIRRTPPPDGVNPGAEWYPEVLRTSDPLEPHVPTP